MPNLSSHIQTFSVFDAPYAGTDMHLESLDGMTQSLQGAAALSFLDGAWDAVLSGALNDAVQLIKQDAYPLYDYIWDKRRQLRFKLSSQIGDDPDGDYYLTTGRVLQSATGFGLKFEPTKIRACLGDGIDVSFLDLFTELTPGDIFEHLYEFILYPGNGLYVWVDGVFKGSIQTNIPSGTHTADTLLILDLFNATIGQAAELRFSRVQVSQDK